MYPYLRFIASLLFSAPVHAYRCVSVITALLVHGDRACRWTGFSKPRCDWNHPRNREWRRRMVGIRNLALPSQRGNDGVLTMGLNAH